MMDSRIIPCVDLIADTDNKNTENIYLKLRIVIIEGIPVANFLSRQYTLYLRFFRGTSTLTIFRSRHKTDTD